MKLDSWNAWWDRFTLAKLACDGLAAAALFIWHIPGVREVTTTCIVATLAVALCIAAVFATAWHNIEERPRD
jgi:hypothetical protein